MHLVALVCVTCLAVLVVNGQQQNVPGRYPGYKQGSPAAPILIEAFVDFQCPDCASDWPVVKQVLDHYGPEQVYFIMHVYPLVMHRQALGAAKAIQIINNRTQNLWPAIDFFFLNQASFFNQVFRDKTEQDLITLLAGYAAKFGVATTDFTTDYDATGILERVDQDLQFGLSRTIYGTPSFYVNGFKMVNFDETTPYNTWVQFIDGLLKASADEL